MEANDLPLQGVYAKATISDIDSQLAIESELPDKACTWIEQVLKSKIDKIQRVTAGEGGTIIRRECYVVDVVSERSGKERYFVRADKDDVPTGNMKRESHIIRFLDEETKVPTQKFWATTTNYPW